MSIRILSMHLTGKETDAAFADLSEQLPAAIRERTFKYKAPQERNRRIAGKGLLMKALKDQGITSETALGQLRYTPTHQPYLEGLDLHFSISHSEDLVVCAVAPDAAVGIDVEKIKPVKLSLMRTYFNEHAWQEILNAGDPETMFFTHWTIREAAIKASGLGLEQVDLAAVESTGSTIRVKDRFFHYKTLFLNHTHAACIASDHLVEEPAIVSLTLDDVLQ